MIKVEGARVTISNDKEAEGVTVVNQTVLVLASVLRSMVAEEDADLGDLYEMLGRMSRMAIKLAFNEDVVEKIEIESDAPKPFKMMFKQKGEDE